jgi:hypothetical protein
MAAATITTTTEVQAWFDKLPALQNDYWARIEFVTVEIPYIPVTHYQSFGRTAASNSRIDA